MEQYGYPTSWSGSDYPVRGYLSFLDHSFVGLPVMLPHRWWLHFYFTVIAHKDIPYMHDRIPNNVAHFLRHNNTATLIT